MRHRKIKGRISRRTSWRKATFKSMANDLIAYERIETTRGKAKALRGFVEPLITMAKKNDSINGRRRAFSKLCDKTMVKKLFDEIAPLFKDVPGGYTRVLASYARKGDGARMAIIELTKRTISDAKMLGIDEDVKTKKTAKISKKLAVKKTDEKESGPDKRNMKDEHHAVPDVDSSEKEKRAGEDVKREKARTEQKKIAQRGIFKRFRRKSI